MAEPELADLGTEADTTIPLTLGIGIPFEDRQDFVKAGLDWQVCYSLLIQCSPYIVFSPKLRQRACSTTGLVKSIEVGLCADHLLMLTGAT